MGTANKVEAGHLPEMAASESECSGAVSAVMGRGSLNLRWSVIGRFP